MVFFINAPAYNENSGGVIALHRLCHLINDCTEHQAFIVALRKPKSNIMRYIRKKAVGTDIYAIDTNSFWKTPVWKKHKLPKNSIVVYPEIVAGNPLKAKHIIRWLLHNPGFHTNKIEYGENELYFKFNSAIKDFNQKNSITSNKHLKVIYYPIDTYFDSKIVRQNKTCYMVRKGKTKSFVHTEDAICIDDLSHSEVAKVFQKSERFICYDDYTAYSIFAVLCGCESIVIPSNGAKLNDWYPNESDRFGISFGLDYEQIKWAKDTRHKVAEHVKNEHLKSKESVLSFVEEVEIHIHLLD